MTPHLQEYRTVPLTRNQVALVDAEDFERVSAWKWYAEFHKSTQTFYAGHTFTAANKKRHILMHRFILGVTDSQRLVDHINHDTLDNRKSNLRIVTDSQNLMNRSIFRNNSSGVPGVNFQKDKGKFRARIYVSGKCMFLGYFPTVDAAARARADAEIRHFGNFRYCADAGRNGIN